MTFFSDVCSFLQSQGQEHLLARLEGFSGKALKNLYDTIAFLPHLSTHSVFTKQDDIAPFTTAAKKAGSKKEAATFLKKKKVAAILLAGGVGSRLDFSGPKGCFPISLIKKKSLFQIHLEKIAVLEKSLETRLSLFILTSENNHEETKNFLEKFSYFGLSGQNVHLIQQPSYPYLNEEKKWFFSNEETLATSPNGNGGLFEALSSQLDYIKEYDHFMVFPIDNPLCTPFDPELLAFHLKEEADITLRCCERLFPDEKVGVFCRHLDKVVLVDYNDLDEKLFTKKVGKKFYFPYGNPNIFFMKKDFLLKMCEKDLLPLHWIEKKIKGELFFKPEKFLTDILHFTNKSSFLLSKRKEHFMPLKNKDGANGIASVQLALLEKDRSILRKLTKIDVREKTFELSLEFHFLDKSLRKRCAALKEIPDLSYVSPNSLH